jgi:hypothetical protein
MNPKRRPCRFITLGAILMLLTGCETDEFFISGTDHCPASSGDVDEDPDADDAPTTSSVMEEPLTEMTGEPGPTGRATPLEPTLPGPTPAQER